jgi:hypothetical protein
MPFSLLAGLLLCNAAPPLGGPAIHPELVAADEAVLKAAGAGTDGPALLAFVRRSTLTGELRTRAEKLVLELGNDSFEIRHQASEQLRDLGPVIVPVLRPALRSRDLETRRRAERLFDQLEKRLNPGLVPAAARLLAVRRVPGSTAALVTYLPDTLSPSEADEIRAALAEISCPGGKPDKEIIAALSDPHPVRRAVAAQIVGRSGSREHAPAVLILLADKDPTVRMRSALGLAFAKEKKAIPVLIDLLAEADLEQRDAIEETLYRLAGEGSPVLIADDTPAGRKKRRAEWLAWWNEHQEKADLGRLRQDVLLGYTLVILFGGSVSIGELGRDGKPMWMINNLNNAVDAHVLPGKRVLIAEYGDCRVTERTFDGKVVWVQQLNTGRTINDSPLRVQRLANGNTFVATSSGVIELNREGKEVFARRTSPIRTAFKYPDGRFAVVTVGNEYVRYDASGKEQKRYRVGLEISNAQGGIDFLLDGGLLAVKNDRVIQYDANGKQVWEATGLSHAYCPTRLPNGNTIVACTGTSRFIEFDRTGRVVRKIPPPGTWTPWLARRR